MDDFEQFLKSQPVRAVPPSWRREILAATEPAAARPPWWRAWLWPSPYAWGALAAAWMVILVLNFAATPSAGHGVPLGPQPTSDQILALLNENRELCEKLLAESAARRPATPPPTPRKDATGALLPPRETSQPQLA